MKSLSLSLIVFFVIAACTPPRIPIEITKVTSNHPPVVGKFVDMQIEVRSIGDESNVNISISLPPMIYSTDQKQQWELSLKDKDPITVSNEICVLEAGAWAIDVGIAAFFDDGEFKYGELSTIVVISGADTGEVLLERDMTFSQQQQSQSTPGTTLRVDPSDCTNP